MVKAERGTPKDIANRMKSRGLQKLKFYCQMCEKQCRDQNGFKQHATSESHMRQMKIFTSNATGIVTEFSLEFEKSFLTTLKMRHGTKKVNANNIYQEMIAYKSHVHMNSTQWTTLTEFVQYLGKTGKCIVEENISDGQGGWYVSFIERDSSIIERREKQLKKDISNQLAEKLLQQRMNTQRIEAAKALDKMGIHSTKVEATSILDNNGDNKPSVKIKLGLGLSSLLLKKSDNKHKYNTAGGGGVGVFGNDEDDDDDDFDEKVPRKKDSVLTTMAAEGAAKMADSNNNNNNDKTKSTTGKRKHQHDNDVKGNRISNDKNEDRGEEKKQKKKSKSSSSEEKQDKQSNSNSNAHAHAWLYRDIIVRIVAKNMEGGKYFRKKAIVDKVLDDTYTAEVEILNDNSNSNNGNGNSNGGGGGGGGDILRLDQNDLETVVPKMKKKNNNNNERDNKNSIDKVRILKGKYRGSKAIIQNLDKVNYHADLKIIKLKVQKQNNDGVVKLKVKGKEDDVGMILKNVQYEDFSQIA
jgi:DNA/RNA-binding protein KIN17